MIYETKDLPSGFKIEVHYDSDPENPRKAWDNAGTVALWDGSRYCFADEKLSRDELQEIGEDEGNLWLPIYIYDHSGITIKTTAFSCEWDSGQIGLIYMSKEKAKHEWPDATDEQIYEYLKGEVEVLDQYLTNEVYGYRIFDQQGEEVASCWGFYGDPGYVMKEAEEEVAYHEEKDLKQRREAWLAALKEAREKRYWQQRGVMTGTLVINYV